MLLPLLFACSGSEAPSATATPAPTEPPKPAAPSGGIVVKGSDSEVNLVQRLSEEFMKTHPGVSISVTGGGSGAGIAAIIDGTTTIANSSRDMKGPEKIEAQRKGVDVKGFVFATDGLAVIVNEKSPVQSLTVDQLGGLFRGEVSTWDTLGGTGAVSLYGRQSNSGTYDYFKSAAVKGEYSPNLKQMNGNAQIVEGVKADPGGIGYVAAGYVAGENGAGVKVVPLVTGGAPVSPLDEAAVLSGAYPLARPLYQFVNGAPTGDLKAFLAFEASPEGQAIVKEMGFYTIGTQHVAANQSLVGN